MADINTLFLILKIFTPCYYRGKVSKRQIPEYNYIMFMISKGEHYFLGYH